MDINSVLKVIFSIAGIAILFISIFRNREFSEKEVLLFNLDEHKSFKANSFGLLIVAGILILFAQVYFWVKDYEDDISTLKQANIRLQDTIQDFKEHDLNVSLIFKDPGNNKTPDINNISWPPEVFLRRKGQSQQAPYQTSDNEKGVGGMKVVISRLKPGDRLQIVVHNGKELWKSDEVDASSSPLELKLGKP